MSASILYAGDDDLTGAAAYLGGVMTHHGLEFDHVRSDNDMPDGAMSGRKLLILSDYPAARFTPGLLDRAVELVRDGMGLLMIGGWESFRGQSGLYQSTALADVLCVEMADGDDRVNCDQPCIMAKMI